MLDSLSNEGVIPRFQCQRRDGPSQNEEAAIDRDDRQRKYTQRSWFRFIGRLWPMAHRDAHFDELQGALTFQPVRQGPNFQGRSCRDRERGNESRCRRTHQRGATVWTLSGRNFTGPNEWRGHCFYASSIADCRTSVDRPISNWEQALNASVASCTH